jgi:hypothetical protein
MSIEEFSGVFLPFRLDGEFLDARAGTCSHKVGTVLVQCIDDQAFTSFKHGSIFHAIKTGVHNK